MSMQSGKLLIVGSVAYDEVAVPGYETRTDLLGGAATAASIAASPLHQGTRLLGVVGADFKQEHTDLLKQHAIDLAGLSRIEGGDTFRWGARYETDLNHRTTLYTHLNVFDDWSPVLPEGWEQTPFVFLANIHPKLQHHVLDSMRGTPFVAMDTMNLWIATERPSLERLLKRVNAVIISDQEALMLTNTRPILQMGRAVQSLGPKTVVIKRGEYGAMLFHHDEYFYIPAHPLEFVIDPTGAGDSFAGGFMGMLARHQDVSMDTMRRAMVAGSVMASFCVQGFGVHGMAHKTLDHLQERYRMALELTRCPEFNPLM